jgi:hypothetical protein
VLDRLTITSFISGPNKGREFAVCPNVPKAQCSYFAWKDDVPQEANVRGTGGGGERSGECYQCHQSSSISFNIILRNEINVVNQLAIGVANALLKAVGRMGILVLPVANLASIPVSR